MRPFPYRKRAAETSSTETEDHVDGGIDFDRLIIEQVRAITPASNGVQSRLTQHGRTVDYLEVLDGAAFGDGGAEHDSAGDAGGLRNSGMDRRRTVVGQTRGTPLEVVT